MATSAVLAKSSTIIKETEEILKKAGGQIAPTSRQRCSDELKSAQQILDYIQSKQRSSGAPADVTGYSKLRTRMNILSNNIGKAVRASSKWVELREEIRNVYTATQELNRVIDLIQGLSPKEMEKILWWMTEQEQDTEEYLGLLLQVKHKIPDHLRELGEIADRRMSERVSKEHDPDGALQTFFALNQKEFAHIISAADWESKLPPSLKEFTPLKTLRLIKEKLKDSVEKNEIDRWLHERNPKFDDRKPVEAIKDGDAFRVLQLLIRLEEGIPG